MIKVQVVLTTCTLVVTRDLYAIAKILYELGNIKYTQAIISFAGSCLSVYDESSDDLCLLDNYADLCLSP